MKKAAEAGVNIKACVGNALDASKIIGGTFDHVLLMGPMYHLLEEEDRICAVNEAIKLLKAGGTLSVSFISLFAEVIYYMVRDLPELILEDRKREYLKKVLSNESYSGDSFTKAHFAAQKDILPFFSRFPLKKLHFFGQEGILVPCAKHLKEKPPGVQEAWLDFAEKLCGREELLSYSEHFMYIGKRI
jgi:SAM-dependent methyltransferase